MLRAVVRRACTLRRDLGVRGGADERGGVGGADEEREVGGEGVRREGLVCAWWLRFVMSRSRSARVSRRVVRCVLKVVTVASGVVGVEAMVGYVGVVDVGWLWVMAVLG